MIFVVDRHSLGVCVLKFGGDAISFIHETDTDGLVMETSSMWLYVIKSALMGHIFEQCSYSSFIVYL